ncbi:hypothetical protein VNI00_004101 [Paramarasmius palmivorus]|uniref:Uncharacterized protein n=1 Tax=Paramarasmius palmivorus TaxID=297713 RepID=A0AAW0DPK7_9AGAR
MPLLLSKSGNHKISQSYSSLHHALQFPVQPIVISLLLPTKNKYTQSTTFPGAASLPIKPFVHEVLRRSRTSGTVLQTALCYLEAIRPKIPSLVQKDKAGIPTSKEPELASRITIATEAELSDGIDQSIEQQGMDTVKVFDAGECPYDSGADSGYGSGSICGSESGSILPTPAADLTPLPPLPSPLLCPRRAFLASLILASKFTQDKTYSNRAWAKLSGLPPREIGRCERALGEELGWRLWVGKTPCASSSPEKVVEETPAAGKTRPVARCQSETNLRSTSSAGAFLAPAPSAPVKPLLNRSGSGLRRSSTLPAEAFTQRQHQPIQRKSHLNNVVTQWIHNSSREDSDTQMYSPTVSIEECCNSVNSGFGDELLPILVFWIFRRRSDDSDVDVFG